jgi:hypothetical protein
MSGRSIQYLRHAAEQAIAEWEAYIGPGDEEGHDDVYLMGAAIGQLRHALATDVAARGSRARHAGMRQLLHRVLNWRRHRR